MNIVRTSAILALTIMAVAFGLAGQRQLPDPIAVSAFEPDPEADRLFRLQVSGFEEDCLVTAASADAGKRPLSLGPACADIVPGLAGSRWWFERADGSVAFITDDGHVAAEFAIADGAAFESYAPRQPIMTLLAR